MAAFPTKPSLAARAAADGVADVYERAAAAGDLLQLGGFAVDWAALLRLALVRFGAPDVVAADRWRVADLRDALEKADVPICAFVERGQGFKDGAEDVRTFRRACAEGKVTPLRSLLIRAACCEAMTVSDEAGNAKLSKGVEGGRRLRARDDAAAAAILAVAEGSRRAREQAHREPTRAPVFRVAVA